MKKLVSLFLVLAMFLSLAPAIAEEPVTIEMWHCLAGANGERLESIVADYNASQSKVYVNCVYQGEARPTLAKVKTTIASGSIPCDILQLGGVYCIQLYSEDLVVNLNPYFEKAGIEKDDFVKGLVQYFLDDEGNQYGIPFATSTPVIYYNPGLLAEIGCEVPTTWDEMREVCQKAKAFNEKGEQTRYGWIMAADEWYWLGYLASHGVSILNEEKTALGCLEDGSLKRGLTRLQEMYQAGEILITPTADGAVPRQAWLDKNAIFWTYSVAGMGGVRQLADFEWGIAPMPKDETVVVPTGGSGFSILAGTGKEDACFDFFQWILTDPKGTLTFVEATGYYPVTYSMANSDTIQKYFAEVPQAKIAFEQLAFADDSHYYCTKVSEIRAAMNALMEAIIFDNADIDEQISIFADTVADFLAE